MRIVLNDFARQWRETQREVLAAVERVGASGWYVLGSEVRAFEGALAQHCAVGHAVGVANGLDAIEIALRALGLRPGERVLTTPLSAFATTLAIVRAGGVPVFCDVDEGGLVDLDAAERAFEADATLRTFVPVHLYGHPLSATRLRALRERFGLRLVEDCAQAVGAPVARAGQLSTLSFYPTKNLGALGDGGAVLTDDPELAAVCRSLRDYGQSAKYVHERLGLNSRLDELHAAVLRDAFLPRLAAWTERRRAIAARYREGLRSVRVPAAPEGSVWHLFPVLVERRDAFLRYLAENEVQSAVHYPQVIPDQPALAQPADVPRAREFAAREASLPIHPYLDDAEVQRVIDVVNGWRG